MKLVDLLQYQNIEQTTSVNLNVIAMNHTDTGSVSVSYQAIQYSAWLHFFIPLIKAKDKISLRASPQCLWSHCYSKKKKKKIHNTCSSSGLSDLLICCASRPSGTLSLPALLRNAACLQRAGKWMLNAAVCRQRSCWMKGLLFGEQPFVCVVPDDTTQWDLIQRLCEGIPVVMWVGKIFYRSQRW